jgi:Tfp pilus assembly protein PilF
MNKPETEEELLADHKLQRSDPRRYIQIANEWIRKNPRKANGYFRRHFAWLQLGEPQKALDDINKAIAIEPDQVSVHRRAKVYRKMGEHRKAYRRFRSRRGNGSRIGSRRIGTPL